MLHIKQLDSIRAIAVLLVILWHWVGTDIFKFPIGPFGVHIFFVLSGFLITQILLKHRREAVSRKQTKKEVLKIFYIRRALRIFPAYYLVISLTILLRHRLQLNFTKDELIASLTYTSNFYFFSIDSWKSTAHFWSLAVEEQFYLIWPLLMLFIPVRYLLQCIICFITIGAVSQFLISGSEMGILLPHTCFDALGFGGLIAWVAEYRSYQLQRFYALVRNLALVSTGILFIAHFNDIEIKQERFLHSWIGAWIITYILIHYNKKTVFIWLLGNKFLVFIGKMSYGIYLYHILYMYLVQKLWARYAPNLSTTVATDLHSWMFFAVNIWGLLFLCWLSYRFIEKPFLSLKDRFAYQSEQRQKFTSLQNEKE